ncbi:MAG: YncE family protein [Clostridium sp.]|uniref:YncE family protein n=1 Tax=Clostridium sp. DSM 8431 TaxID=1761781 RepID=UPI0008E04EA5|nr:YncE family protein [Clostridium sp. DSM 8431]MCR4944990.1 YncE family protein [Clostridium sp.]SFU60561.1 40-residue YVTN family beta-propeller repeat-containing protein [Clostridium sp. DSM 8431]
MQSIFVCNIASDSISQINCRNFSVKNYPLDLGERPVGPTSLAYSDGSIIICNKYNNSISVFDLKEKKETAVFFAGPHPSDIKVFKENAYVVLSESNSIAKIDLQTGNIICIIPVGEDPYSIEINEERAIAYVSNMKSNLVSLIDLEKDIVIKDIKTNEDPTKIFLSKDKKVLYLCESYLGKDVEGYIVVISSETNEILNRIRVGMCPLDLAEDDGKLYVTNFNEGTLSIIDKSKQREVKKIHVGGMPKGIIKRDNDIFIGDYINNRVFKINLRERMIKNITVGGEPNAMILV